MSEVECPGKQVDQQHFAAIGLDDVVSDHLFARVIGALDQHVRPDPLDQIPRRVFLEHHDEIDSFQRSQHFGARLHLLHRTIRALEPRDRSIAVEPEHQPVARSARLRHQLDMPGMQDVETSVGETDA